MIFTEIICKYRNNKYIQSVQFEDIFIIHRQTVNHQFDATGSIIRRSEQSEVLIFKNLHEIKELIVYVVLRFAMSEKVRRIKIRGGDFK